MDDVNRFPILFFKRGPPDLVPPYNFAQAALQHVRRKGSVTIEGYAFVEERNVGRHLRVQPDLELGERERDGRVRRTVREGRLLPGANALATTQSFQDLPLALSQIHGVWRDAHIAATPGFTVCRGYAAAHPKL